MTTTGTSPDTVALMIRAIVDLPSVERIELVTGRFGPFLRVHLEPGVAPRSFEDQHDAAWSVRMIAGCMGSELGGRFAVDIVEDPPGAPLV